MQVANFLPDSRVGGPQRRGIAVAERLEKRGIETTFFFPDGPGDFHQLLQDRGISATPVKFPRPRSPWNLRKNFRYLLTFFQTISNIDSKLKDQEPDIVHLNGPLSFQPAVSTTRLDVPLVWHFNDVLTPWPLNGIAARIAKRYADQIIVASDAVHNHFFDEKINTETVYAPVDLSKFNPDIQSDVKNHTNRNDDTYIIGTVGNINPVKGHKYLLEAVARLAEEGVEMYVPIIGEPLKSRQKYFTNLLKKVENLGIENIVEFLGYRDDIPKLLLSFDIFALPSLSEACPMSILEAMAMKCPVIATEVGGVPEQIPDEEYGWTVPPQDTSALADALREALRSPDERTRRAENARQRVKEKFSLDVCVDKHETVYRNAIKTKR